MAILVPYDGSHPARKAVEYAVREHPDERIVLLRIVEAAGGSIGAGLGLAREELKERRREIAGKLSEEIEESIDTTDVEFRTETVIGKPSRKIIEFAAEDENGIEQIVIGSHGREGMSRVLLGSVAETVVRRASVPVTVIR